MRIPYLYLLSIICQSSIIYCFVYNSDVTIRLPEHIRPVSYDLELTPYLDEKHSENRNFTFDGNIKIVIENYKDKNNEIILHARNLKINNGDVKITNEAGDKSFKFTSTYTKENQFLTLTIVDDILAKGKYIVAIKYQGKINKNWNGFYRSRYDEKSDYVAATQFSANAARRAFPCFDEPGIKAFFKLTMNHNEKYVALSNMPFIDTKKVDENSDRLITQFETLKIKIPPFLVAFALINYNLTPKKGVPQTIYVPEFLQNNTKLSLEHATQSVNFMQNFTDIKYKLPKLDHLAVPVFAAGAMENWGLITYKTENLIFDPNKDTAAKKQNVLRVIAHEVSHQWFGNLVTPEWWDYIWLSEGFATYWEYFINSNLLPEWKLMEQFIVNVQQSIMLYDATDRTHALTIHVANPDFWSADFLDYHKGACIVRMISNIMGTEKFQKGLRTYLTELSEDVTNNDKLWKSLQTQFSDDVDIAEIGNSWLQNSGFPLVNITRIYTSSTFNLVQQQFVFLHEITESQLWSIPIRIVTKSDLDFSNLAPTHWFNTEKLAIQLEKIDTFDWYILNPEQAGYYRVNYDLINWQKLIEYLNSPNFEKIPPITRSQLIDDSLNLATAGYLEFDTALSLTNYLHLEADVVPWLTAIAALKTIHVNAMQSDFDWNYKIFMQTVSEKIYEKLSNNFQKSDDHLISIGQTKILPKLCNIGIQDCIDQSKNILIEKVLPDVSEELDEIPADLQGVIYCYGIKDANENMWMKLYEAKYTENWNNVERSQVAFGLGCSSNEKILKKYLNMLLEPDMTPGDRTIGFQAILSNLPIGINVALDFLEAELKKIRESFNDLNLITIMEEFANHVVTPEQVKRFKHAANQLDPVKSKLMATAIKIAEDNLKWHENYYPTLKEWFSKTITSTPASGSSTDDPEGSTVTAKPSRGFRCYVSFALISLLCLFVTNFN